MRGKKNSYIFVAFLVLGLAGALSALYFLSESAKNQGSGSTGLSEDSRPGTGAYARGGRPTTGPARHLFEAVIPEFVIRLDAWIRTSDGRSDAKEDMREARGTVVLAARQAGLDANALTRLTALLDASSLAATASEDEIDGVADEFMKRTLSLNDALASAGLGFFVDGEILDHGQGKRSVLLFTFEVRRVVLYRSGGHDLRTLRVRRLDKLNWTYTLLGFTTPERLDAVVIDDKVDEHLLKLLPALAEDLTMDPFQLELKDTYTPWFSATRALATSIIREELGTAGDGTLQELGTLLARRLAIYSDWNERLDAREMRLDPPKTLAVTWNYRMQMEGLVTQGAMDELEEIQKKLSSDALQAAFAKAHDHIAQSFERHETQHRIDFAKLYTLPMPKELARYVGELPEGFQGENDLASGALAEMSAYLSELARDPLTPRLNLTLITGYLLDPRAWGMGESYAALAILLGLADELSIAHTELVVARRIDRAAVAALYQALCAVTTSELRNASGSLWARLFETELPTLELIAR